MLYAVEITETLSRTIYVAANDKNEALYKADCRYCNGDEILDSSDFVDYELKLISEDD